MHHKTRSEWLKALKIVKSISSPQHIEMSKNYLTLLHKKAVARTFSTLECVEVQTAIKELYDEIDRREKRWENMAH